MINVTSTIGTGTVYSSFKMEVKGNTFSFMQAVGKENYVNIRKETNNPFKGLGKQFATWEDAENNYKSPEMQMAIFSAQSIFAAQ